MQERDSGEDSEHKILSCTSIFAAYSISVVAAFPNEYVENRYMKESNCKTLKSWNFFKIFEKHA